MSGLEQVKLARVMFQEPSTCIESLRLSRILLTGTVSQHPARVQLGTLFTEGSYSYSFNRLYITQS